MAHAIKIHPARTIPYPIHTLNHVSEYELINHASNLALLWIWSSPSPLIFNSSCQLADRFLKALSR